VAREKYLKAPEKLSCVYIIYLYTLKAAAYSNQTQKVFQVTLLLVTTIKVDFLIIHFYIIISYIFHLYDVKNVCVNKYKISGTAEMFFELCHKFAS